METTSESTVNTTKKNNWGYKITIVILLAIIGFMAWELNTTKENLTVTIIEKKQGDSQKLKMQFELDSLMYKFDSIKTKYGALNKKLTTQDSIILKYANQIQELLFYHIYHLTY